jgi:hypothetical protein
MAASLHPQRALRWPILFAVATVALHAQELPKKDGSGILDFEPKLMHNDLPDLPLPSSDPSANKAAAAPSMNVARLEAQLEKARKNAAWLERLYKAGVLAKIEAEQGALKIVRISTELENARLQALTRAVEEKRKLAESDEISPEALSAAETALAEATAAARAATARWDEAQRAAAELRLQRERRLLAVGAGSRSSVKRAEAALQVLAAGQK